MTKKTKITATIGPSSWKVSTLRELILAGMNVTRLNFSHGTHEEKRDQIKAIRKLSKDLKKPIAIIADLQGPKLRLGSIDGTKKIHKGEELFLSASPISDEIPIQYDLAPFVQKDQRIYLNDGLIELKVVEVIAKTIKAKAQNSGEISSHKGINIPDTTLTDANFTVKDQKDAIFALGENVDYIALSFVQKAEDLRRVRTLIKTKNSKAKVIVKIEKKEAVSNLEEIIQFTDAVMVARGDLAIEIDAAEVPIVQQKIIKLSRQYQKPVIVATQMLESMTTNPRPTRAEVSDVANAVLDQVDSVMLSAESASGMYPVEAVKTMENIILAVEENPDYKHSISINWQDIALSERSYSAIASAASVISSQIHAKIIAVATSSGKTAKNVASFRPDSKIVAITQNEQVRNQLSLVWGINSLVVDQAQETEAKWKNILDALKKEGLTKRGDKIVIISGSKIGSVAGATDTIKIAEV